MLYTTQALHNNTCSTQHMLYTTTHALYSNTCSIQQHMLYTTTHALCNTCSIQQHMLYATHALYNNTCSIQHMLYTTHALCNNTCSIQHLYKIMANVTLLLVILCHIQSNARLVTKLGIIYVPKLIYLLVLCLLLHIAGIMIIV